MKTIQERVAAGVKLLDEKGPKDWRDRIDVDSLNLDSPVDCVIGQVYGHPLPAHDRWGSYLRGTEILGCYGGLAQHYGFDTNGDPNDFAELTYEWVGVIASQPVNV